MALLEKEFKAQREETRGDLVLHRTSASSIKTYKMCKRKWWLGKIRKLTTYSSQANIFGTILHAVAERFLRADDQGYDRETNEPVELYPDEWHIARNTYAEHIPDCRGHKEHPEYVEYEDVGCDCPHPIDGELSIDEQALVKKLVSEAIDAGVLERHPGREVEAKIGFDAFHEEGLGSLSWVGYIDVLEPDMVQDHKTTGRMKYALSKAKLFDDLQMNLYGYHSTCVRPDANPELEKFWFRHNVYCKDTNDTRVRKTEVEKPVEEIRAFYDREIEPCFKEMLLLIKNVDSWHDINPPVDIAGSCNAYGGCPFLSICAGGETPDMYIRRVDKTQTLKKNPNKKETKTMSSMSRRMNNKETPATPSPQNKTPESKEVVTPEESSAPEISKEGAPWYIDGCKACSSNPTKGIGSNGQPCLVCVSKNRGKINVADYTQQVDDDGTIRWTAKASGETVVTDSSTADKDVKAEESVGSKKDVEKANEAKASAAKKKAEVQKEADQKAEAKKVEEKKAEAQKIAEKKEPETVTASGEDDLPSTTALELDPKVSAVRKKFILLLGGTAADGTMSNASAIGNAGRLITLEELMLLVGTRVGEQYAEKLGKTQRINYYDINAFERRDFVAAHAEEIADLLGNSTLACPRSPTPDENSLLSALRPLALKVLICST